MSIPPETKHWHGAAPDSWFSHVAIAVPAEGASNEWLEPVADEEYAALALMGELFLSVLDADIDQRKKRC